MEITFMSIHNLSPHANLLFASESIEDILGFQPHEVFGKSCFDYFHPDDVPFAKDEHADGIRLDKAAVLSYARIKGSKGEWVNCECVFSIVYDVLVACTSIYKGDAKGLKRQEDAPVIQRLFSAAPKDRRYHMLQHLSAQFYNLGPELNDREPRAALILNRFTRTLTVMFATNAVTGILGIAPAQLVGKSFYECIQQECLSEAIKCLESAKANDSIAYLRFWYRHPSRPESQLAESESSSSSSDDSDGGVPVSVNGDDEDSSLEPDSVIDQAPSRVEDTTPSTGDSDIGEDTSTVIFDRVPDLCSKSSKSSTASGLQSETMLHQPRYSPREVEIEAVVSCTSDGLVVVLRAARISSPSQLLVSSCRPDSSHFAAPWSSDIPGSCSSSGEAEPHETEQSEAVKTSNDTHSDDIMHSIQECAVFAWSLTGINGTLGKYARGMASGEAVPATGLPVWAPDSLPSPTCECSGSVTSPEEPTNEPQKDDHGLPHAHHHQEELLRRHHGYSDGPMGSDRAGSFARRHLGKLIDDKTLGTNKESHLSAPPSDNVTNPQVPASSSGGVDNPVTNENQASPRPQRRSSRSKTKRKISHTQERETRDSSAEQTPRSELKTREHEEHGIPNKRRREE